MNIVNNALKLAYESHEGQYRNYGDKIPYIFHPTRVALLVATASENNPTYVAAAFLHDVLEDTLTPAAQIERQCGEAVCSIVQELTNPSKLPEHSKKPRKERKRIDREHIQSASYGAKLIKLCDRIDNLHDLVEGPRDFQVLYANESLLLLEALSYTNEGLEKKLAESIEALLR